MNYLGLTHLTLMSHSHTEVTHIKDEWGTLCTKDVCRKLIKIRKKVRREVQAPYLRC
jgi:hypothetical protein